MRLQLEVVRKGIELGRLAQTMRERLGEEPVREPRIARQERAVEVRAEDAPGAAEIGRASCRERV